MALKTWQGLSDADRATLIENTADSRREVADYLACLQRLCGEHALTPLSPEALNARDVWRTADTAPPQVSAMLARLGSDLDWSVLGMFGRYVLTHLARRDAVEKFSAAAAEFADD